MNKIFENLLKPFKEKTTVTLETRNGFYVVKCYGQYLVDSLTSNYDEALARYNRTIDYIKEKDKTKYVIIKETKIWT